MTRAEKIEAAMESLQILLDESGHTPYLAFDDHAATHGQPFRFCMHRSQIVEETGETVQAWEVGHLDEQAALELATLSRTRDVLIELLELALEYGDLPEGKGSRFAALAEELATQVLGANA